MEQTLFILQQARNTMLDFRFLRKQKIEVIVLYFILLVVNVRGI